MAKTLQALAERVDGAVIGEDVTVSDVVHDHRDADSRSLFVARRGLTVDGHSFVVEAASQAAAVCVEVAADDLAVPQLVVKDTAQSLGPLASAVHNDPFAALRAVAVTGTNGKTMVTRLIGSIIEAGGGIPAVAGTLGWRLGSADLPLQRTTPEASDLHRMAAAMVDGGADVAAFEVSSHALSLERIGGARFALAAFTNLSQDHLDFHGDMESYFAAKAGLFVPEFSEGAVIWTDDPAGARLATTTSIATTTVGSEGDVTARTLNTSIDGTTFRLGGSFGEADISLAIAGSFNVANAAVAATSALLLDIPLATVVAGLEAAPAVPGRFEVIATGLPFTVVVDYAHTPDGVRNAIGAARQLTDARVHAIVGAGGDRDPDKRPLMGAAASTADHVYVTNDNPRSEDPAAIAQQVRDGAGDVDVTVELDRRLAIRAALTAAAPDDVVLILGKGHEDYQEFADRVEKWNDASAVVEEAAAL